MSEMQAPISADDLWPLVQKLSHAEQLRLAKLAFRAATGDSDAAAYRASPPTSDEFGAENDALSWDAEGWEGIDAPR